MSSEAIRDFEEMYDRRRTRKAAAELNTTDLGNGERLAMWHGKDLRYCHRYGKWFVWNGKRWEPDNSGEVARRAKDTVRRIYDEASAATDDNRRKELARHALRSEAAARVEAMIKCAQSEADIPAAPDQLDADGCLLNVENGTIDLRTGELREHRREDLITKLCPVSYDPDAECPTWDEFLERVLPSEALRRFVQRLVGYCLTGDVSEQMLFFLYGVGANGKSTLINAILEMLGDYGRQAAPELLTIKRHSHPTELADLKDARFVPSVEVEDGRRLAESLVKQLTGGDVIKARFMRQDFFEFAPTHKVLLAANHKPVIRGTDHAIWRRIKLIPFEVVIPDDDQDTKLPEKLRAELPGILAWAVRGCLGWQAEGLGEPDEVKAATEQYRGEMDVLAAFIEECCVVHPSASIQATPLYEAYKGWCEANGEDAETQRKFGTRLAERGYEKEKSGVYYWRGIGLRYDGPDGDDSGPSGGDSGPSGGGLEANPEPGVETSGQKTDQNADQPRKGPNGLPIGKSPDFSEESGPSGLKVTINSSRNAREAVIGKKGPEGPKVQKGPGPEAKKRRLTEDETRQVQRLIHEGMDPGIARAEVLGEDRA